MAKLAYIRVSSEGQNTARERKALKAAGCTAFLRGEDFWCNDGTS